MKVIQIAVFLFLICISNNIQLFANEKVHVFTKIIENSYEYSKLCELTINANKAKISITGKNQPNIQIRVKLISKNKDQAQAKSDLKYMEGNLHKTLTKIFVNNYIIQPEGVNSISSNLMAVYEISVPINYVKISIKNNIGSIKLTDLNGEFSFTTNYTDMETRNLSGKVFISNKFGNIVFENCTTEGIYFSSYSKINLIEFSGKNELHIKSGTLTVQPNESVKRITIESLNSGVYFINKNCNAFNFNISVRLGNIYITENCNAKDKNKINLDTRNSLQDWKHFKYFAGEKYGTIKIESLYEDVFIQ